MRKFVLRQDTPIHASMSDILPHAEISSFFTNKGSEEIRRSPSGCALLPQGTSVLRWEGSLGNWAMLCEGMTGLDPQDEPKRNEFILIRGDSALRWKVIEESLALPPQDSQNMQLALTKA